MVSALSPSEAAQLEQTIEMFEVITQSQPQDYSSLEILKEAYAKLGRENEAVGTSKRIAQAYVQMGQLSSAILEYETILQRCPEDPDVVAALKQIETRANSFPEEHGVLDTNSIRSNGGGTARAAKDPSSTTIQEVDDGKAVLRKLFVDAKLIHAGDFDLCWPSTPADGSSVCEPFIHVLAEKGVMPVEKSLRIISEKSRAAFLPLQLYDLDIDLARSFPGQVCRRWCILPFDRMSKSILVATANPFNHQAAKELAASTPHRLLWYLAAPAELMQVVRKTYR